MAHIEKRGKNRWRARYRDPAGQERSRTFRRRGDAENFLTSVKHARAIGQYIDPAGGRLRLNEWAGRWLEALRPHPVGGAGPIKPATFVLYQSLLRSRVLPNFGAYRLAAIRPSDIQTWIASMQADGLGASRTRQAAVVLREILDAAVRDGLLGANPLHGAKLPKLGHREAQYFEPAAVDAIAASIPEPYGLLMQILGVLGLRIGEAVALRRRHVDLVHKRIKVEESLAEVSGRLVFGRTKSHAARAVPLTPGLALALDRHLEHYVRAQTDALLFTGPKGGPLRYRYVYMRLWRPALEALGLPQVGLHVLRHSAAARLIGVGASPKALQTILGHRSAAFSLTVYGHLFPSDLDDLAARLDLPAASPRPGAVPVFNEDTERAV